MLSPNSIEIIICWRQRPVSYAQRIHKVDSIPYYFTKKHTRCATTSQIKSSILFAQKKISLINVTGNMDGIL